MAMDFITVTTQFVAGTKARASEINANLSDITDSLSDASKDIYIGGFAKGIASTNATMTIADDSNISTYVINNTTTAAVVTLPTAADNTGRILTVKKGGKTEAAGKVTVKGEAAAEAIDGVSGSTGLDLLNQYEYVTIQCDGSDWFIIERDPGRMQLKSAVPNILDSDHLLNRQDLPSDATSTSYFGWHINGAGDFSAGAWIASEALTEVASIDTSTNHLGDTAFCDFTGTGSCCYANSATFDNTNTSFAAGAWFKLDASGSDMTVISKYGAANANRSWLIRYDTSSNDIRFLLFYDNGGNAITITNSVGNSANLTNGNFHHVAGVYDQATNSVALYLNGNIVAYKIDSNLATKNDAAAVKLTIGAEDGSGADTGPANFFDGEICEAFYAKDVLTASEIRKIYVAGSKKFAVQDGNSKVSIQDGRKSNGYYQVLITASYTVTTSYADATGYSIYIPEAGTYRIYVHGSADTNDTDTTTAVCYIRLYDGSAELPGSTTQTLVIGDSNSERVAIPFTLVYTGYFAKDTNVTLQAYMAAGDNSVLLYASNQCEPSISWEKLD